MQSQLSYQQRERFNAFLAHQRTCIICTSIFEDAWAMPVWYRVSPGASGNQKPEIDCLVPRWSDAAHHLDQIPEVVIIVQASSTGGLRWLQIQGTVQTVKEPDWQRLLPRWFSTVQPEALYKVVRVMPKRIDLVDEEQGWGVRETLEW